MNAITIDKNLSVPVRPGTLKTPASLCGENKDKSLTAPAEHGLLERRYAIARQYSEQGVGIFDRDQRLVHANDQYAKMYGLAPSQLCVGMPLRDILALRIAKGIYGSNGAEAYKRERLKHVTRRKTSISDLNDGRCILIVQQPTINGQWITTHEDITERLKTEAHVTFLATRDPLTGLVNRTALMARLNNALHQLGSDEYVCAMLIDLDHFKPVNDTYGHDVGDEVLKIAAARIRCHVRDTDIVARLGGDEFVVAQAPVKNTESISNRISRVISALAQPIVTLATPLKIGASAGVAVAPPHQATVDELLKHADEALYTAKNAGRGTFHLNDLSDKQSDI